MFRLTYNKFLEGDLEFIKKCCGEVPTAYFSTEFKRRQNEKWEPMIKELLDVSGAETINGRVPDQDNPYFTLHLRSQELVCNLSLGIILIQILYY